MKKIMMIASLMMLLLAAANAQADSIYSINLLGYPNDGVEYDKFISAEIKVTLDDAATGLSIEIKNTSTVSSSLTALAFSLPDGVTLSADSIPTGWNYSPNESFNSGGGLADYYTDLNAAVLTGSNFKGGDPADGIAPGTDWVTFTFDVAGLSNSSLADVFAPFVARLQGIQIPEEYIPAGWGTDDNGRYLEGSCVATPTPVPGAVWLLGSGLIGLVGLRRRFSS